MQLFNHAVIVSSESQHHLWLLMPVLLLFVGILFGCDQPTNVQAKEMAKLKAVEIGSISHLHEYQGIYFAGQPMPEDFAELKNREFQSVINLRLPIEMGDFDEAKVVTDLGMTYHYLPWNGPGEMTDEMMGQVREILRQSKRPVLLHCASANRVGAVWLPYRVLDDGVTYEQALQEAKMIGMRTPEYEIKARDYIKRMKK